MLKIKTKKYSEFGEGRMIYFAEMPKLQEGELSAVKQKKEAEGPELDIAGLVSKSNGIIDGYTAQLAELPIEFNQMLHNEIVKYFLASPGRYEKDENSGLSTAEFGAYRADMVNKVSALMKEYAPTEEDLKAVKETKKGAESAKGQAEKVEPLDVKEVTESPGQINDLSALNDGFSKYAGWNASLQKEGAEVIKTAGTFQQAYAKYEKARKGVRAYKQFMAYLWPEEDQERIALQNKLTEAKSKVAAAIAKFEATKEKLANHGSALGEVSNRLKQEKMAERDTKIKEVENTTNQTSESRKAKEEQYKNLEARKKEMESSRDNLVNYREKIGESKKEFKDRAEVAENKRDQLTEFNGALKSAVERIDNALANPDLPPETRAQLEHTRQQLEGKKNEAGTGLNAATKIVEGGAKTVVQLEGAEKEAAERSLNLNTHIDQQVNPAIDGLDASIANLDEAKMQFATTKEQVNAHYQKAFEQYDSIDSAVDGAVMQNNLANENILNSLRSQQGALNSANLSPPKGELGAIEATIGVPFSMLGGAIGMAGEGLLDQAAWLSKSLEDARSEMGTFSYVAARIGVELVSTPIGVAGGLVEMAGGIVTLVAHPIDTVKGLGALVGTNPDVSAGEAWEGMGKALISYEDFKAGRIGVGIGKLFANVATTVTGAGALGAGGKAAQGTYVAARMGTATVAKVGVTRALARAGVAGARESAVYIGSAVKSGVKGAVAMPGKTTSNIISSAGRLRRRGKASVTAKADEMGEAGRMNNKSVTSHLDDSEEAIPLVRRKAVDEPIPLNRRKKPADTAAPKSKESTSFEEAPTEAAPYSGEDIKVFEEAPTVSAKAKQRPSPADEATGAATPKAKQRPSPADEATGAATPKAKQRPLSADEITHPEIPKKSPASPDTTITDHPSAITAAERAEAAKAFAERMDANPALSRQLEEVARKNGMSADDLNKLDAAEMQILGQMPPEALTESVMQKIIKGEFDEIVDVVDGQRVAMRYYIDDSLSLGKGGMGKVNVGYAVRWVKDTNGRLQPVFQRGAIKQIHPEADLSKFSARSMMEFEEATLDAVRNLPNQDGLLRPQSIGRRIIRDVDGNIMREELIAMTELMEPLPGVPGVSMRDVIDSLPLDQSLGYLDQVLEGMEKLHGLNRMHLDVKPSNFFAGTVNGRPKAVLGDLGAVPAENLRYMEIETFLYKGEIIHQPVIKLPDGREINIPISPSYARRGVNQLRYAIEWAKANPGVKVPESITAITDLGQTAKVVEYIQHVIKNNPRLLPPGQAAKIRARLRNVTTSIDNVPDMTKLDEAIEAARLTGDPEKISKAMSARAAALQGTPSVSVGGVRSDLRDIAAQIRIAQKKAASAKKAPTLYPFPF